ncbi:hypothetical protein D3C75_855040 [compost metagenome]
MTKLKVDMVSRELGRHKGDLAHLIMDANMVERAITSARMIAAHCGHSVAVFDEEHDHIVDRMIEHIASNMHTPAVDLLSDFRDEYTASGNRITEMSLKGTPAILQLTVSLRREPPATVRVSSIAINIVQKAK